MLGGIANQCKFTMSMVVVGMFCKSWKLVRTDFNFLTIANETAEQGPKQLYCEL